MVDLEVFVKLDALNKVLMTNTSHYRKYFNLLTIIFDLEMVRDERVIFIAHGHHLLIRTDVKGEWLSIMVPAFIG